MADGIANTSYLLTGQQCVNTLNAARFHRAKCAKWEGSNHFTELRCYYCRFVWFNAAVLASIIYNIGSLSIKIHL